MAYQIYSNSAPTLSNLTLNTTYSGAGTYQVTGHGGYTLATGSSNGTWATNPYVTVGATTNSVLKVSGDADIQGNLTVNGSNISEILAKIQDRLAILVPDPKRLEKYEALQQAYEHYKLLEALCVEQNNPNE